MTPEQRIEVKKIRDRLQLLFQGFHGNIQFNMNPNAKDKTNVNVKDRTVEGVDVNQNHLI